MKIDPETMQSLERLEEQLWIERYRFDRVFMDERLAKEFVEIGASGRVYGRAEILDTPERVIGVMLPLADFTTRLLAPGLVISTYISSVSSSPGVKLARRCSIWRETADGWVLVFHQGTPVANGA